MRFNILTFKSVLMSLVLMLAVPSGAQAALYYVDQKHPAASDRNAGTIEQPWKTIAKANQTLAPGDSVEIKAGTYTSYIAPENSGSSAKPITYRNYGTDTVTITETSYGVYLNGKSYIIVQGIDFFNLDQFLWFQNNASHNTIAYCNFDKARNVDWHGSRIYRDSSYNWIHHSRFSKYGRFTRQDIGSVLDIGDEESKTDMTSHNLIEDSSFFHGGHHVLGVFGRYNVIRNNYFHNEPWSNGYGNRNVYLAGYPENSGWNLIEGNRIAYSSIPPDNWGSPGLALSTKNNIIRRNEFLYNDQSGIALTLSDGYYSDVTFNKIYNNTFLHNGWNMATGRDVRTSAVGFSVYSGSHIIKHNSLKNNIYYDHYQTYGSYRVSLGDQVFEGNWDGDSQGDPRFVNASKTPGDPLDPSVPDMRLRKDSPCLDAGTYLTAVAESGSGNSLKVADSSYFMDGWGIPHVKGDEIQLQGSSEKARIVSINHSANTILVDRILTWEENQGIALPYAGPGPDIGAHEHLPLPPPKAPSDLKILNTGSK
jgi:hypothetical protein